MTRDKSKRVARQCECGGWRLLVVQVIVRPQPFCKEPLKIRFIDAFSCSGRDTRRIQRKVPRLNVAAQDVEQHANFVRIVDDGCAREHNYFCVFRVEQVLVHLHGQTGRFFKLVHDAAHEIVGFVDNHNAVVERVSREVGRQFLQTAQSNAVIVDELVLVVYHLSNLRVQLASLVLRELLIIAGLIDVYKPRAALGFYKLRIFREPEQFQEPFFKCGRTTGPRVGGGIAVQIQELPELVALVHFVPAFFQLLAIICLKRCGGHYDNALVRF